MAASEKTHRIIFLDLLRALAVVMMVQGHTIDVLLSDEFRNNDNWVFRIWQFGRGMTAPIFLLTSGTVFIYLLRSTALPFHDNPRVAKGIKRAILLIAFGYLLRFPSRTITGIFYAPAEQWRAFYTVDALQLIGMGILLLLLGSYLSEKMRLNDLAVFGLGGLFFFVCSPFFEQIIWSEWLPSPIAAYLSSGSGSLFPLFPWVGYVMFGGLLGAYLAGTGYQLDPPRLCRRLMVAGTALLMIYQYFGQIKASGSGSVQFWSSNPDIVLLRLGSALLLIVPIALLSAGPRALFPIIPTIGRRTLPIYLLHLLILYGSPWNTGINRTCDRCLTIWPALSAALLMLVLMIGVAVLLSLIEFDRIWARFPRCKSKNRSQKATSLVTR
jgi:surface polysaccharide O-acyltransferase-like enzyme